MKLIALSIVAFDMKHTENMSR